MKQILMKKNEKIKELRNLLIKSNHDLLEEDNTED